MRDIKRIILHCSDSPDENDKVDAKMIKTWHKERGWKDIGYHFVITRDGSIQIGRPIHIPGAHVKGHNDDSIGICWVGRNLMTDYQVAGIRQCISGIFGLHEGLGIASIFGHNDFNPNKTCPNLNIHWVRAMMLSTYHLLIGKHKHHLMLLDGGEREDVDNQLDT